MSQSTIVRYEVRDQVATITLNRPETLNAMTGELMAGITDGCTRVRADESIRALVITGEGRGFCSGADLNNASAPSPSSEATERRGEDTFNTAMRALYDCPVPTVARVNGAAAGGGFGLALACDITVASEKAFFVATFGPNLGIVPDMGATWSIPLRAGRARAMGITLLGERISAAQAQEWGLIWRCVPHEELDDAVTQVVATLKRSSPSTVTRIRQSIDAAKDNTFSEQLDLEMVHQAVLIPRNMQRGAEAFLAKRTPEFGGERD
ncbi:MAG: enoyl-CoA hydratase-related protein [Pseudomonadota bacterium]